MTLALARNYSHASEAKSRHDEFTIRERERERAADLRNTNREFTIHEPSYATINESSRETSLAGTFTTEPGWTSALTLGLDKQFNQDMELMNALPYGLNGANSSDPTCVEMERMRAIVRDAPCNTVFPCTSFWPTTYEAAYGFFRDSYHGGANGTAVGKELHRLALVDKDRFNIAIHVRDGDQVPTEISYVRERTLYK